MYEQPLSGIKVLDLGHYIAGPFCTKLFADFGAEVIKVERPDGGDPARKIGPFPGDIPHLEKSGLFLHLNTNKRGITLNLRTETGQRIVKELVRDADILVESFRPGVMASWGLSYGELSAVNPNLIITSISNFGQTGPYRDYLGTELTLFAMGGRMSRIGLPHREPLKLGGEQHQYQAGHCAAMATISALYNKEFQGGGGDYIDVSIYETLMASYNGRMPNLITYAFAGERGVRVEAAAAGYPSDWYPTKDGYMHISASGAQFPRLAALLGRPELATDPRFTGAGQRDPQAREEFYTTIWFPWLMERTAMEAVEEAQRHEVRAGLFSTIGEAAANPQWEARGYIVEIDHPEAGKFKYLGAPFGPIRAAHDWWRVRRPAPTLGQHNEQLLGGQLGYSKEDLVRLRERGII